MILKSYFLKKFFLALFYFEVSVRADFSVQLSGCPSGFQRINNGCYDFKQNPIVDAIDADFLCKNSYAKSHLIALESLAETIALSFWMKGSNFTNNFWTDAVNDVNNNIKVWSWSKQTFYNYGYLRVNFLKGVTKNRAYLKYNASQLYELDDKVDIKMGYICEAQVPCQPSDNVCHNNGTCYVNAGTALCDCPKGYQGSYCEIMIDNCKSSPCSHGGTCNNLPNNYNCSCNPFYEGFNCDNEIKYKYERAQSTVLAIACSIVGAILLFLCMLDLPWKALWRQSKICFSFRGEDDEKKQKFQKTDTLNPSTSNKGEFVSAGTLASSEKEMLKKLKIAIKNSQSSSRTNSSNVSISSP